MTNAADTDGASILDPAYIDAAIEQHDLSGFHVYLEGLPQQARDAWGLAQSWPLPPDFRTPSRVLLLGVGGSAIGADIVATLARLGGRVPIEVVRHYEVPDVDENALVIAASFSGNTEETLAALEATLTTPGMRIALTTGGRLEQFARARSIPLISYEWPGPPRTALGYGLFTILGVLARIGAIDIEQAAVDRAIDALSDAVHRYGVDTEPNEAKRLATMMGHRLPVIIGADFLDVAARRFASEVSENAKHWAFWSALPEFNHNTLQALGSANGVPRAIIPIILDAPAVHARNRRRVDETIRMMGEHGMDARVVDAGGDTPLEAIVRAASLASWTSYYLALLNGVDPTPVSVLDTFKTRMGSSATE